MKKIFILFAIIIIGCPFVLNATVFQNEPGKITGKVIDSISNEALFGSNVSIEGTKIGRAHV